MSDITLILEVLKFLLTVWSIYKYFQQKKREKALSAELERITQRLTKLENITSKQLEE